MRTASVLKALVVSSIAWLAGSVQAQNPEFSIREQAPRTGSLIRRDVAWSIKIPINRTYQELSDQEKATIRSNYESMPLDDEPPFPEAGLKPVMDAIHKGQAKRLAQGELRFLVTVGPDGAARDVTAYGTVDDAKMTNFAASVLMLTKYKPALCNGTPCTMQFPFRIKLSVRR